MKITVLALSALLFVTWSQQTSQPALQLDHHAGIHRRLEGDLDETHVHDAPNFAPTPGPRPRGSGRQLPATAARRLLPVPEPYLKSIPSVLASRRIDGMDAGAARAMPIMASPVAHMCRTALLDTKIRDQQIHPMDIRMAFQECLDFWKTTTAKIL